MKAGRRRSSLFDPLVTIVARPIVRAWLRTAEMSDPRLPKPSAHDRTLVPAHDVDHLLLIGNGAAVGYGVLSHDLALAGHLSRQIARITGNATHVSVIAEGEMTASSALATLRAADLESLDGIVMTVGVNEALSLASAARWERNIDELLDYLDSPETPRLHVFMVAIPGLRSITVIPTAIEVVVDAHSAELNRRLAAACERHSGASYVAFDAAPDLDHRRYRGTETYRDWAALIVEPIARVLH